MRTFGLSFLRSLVLLGLALATAGVTFLTLLFLAPGIGLGLVFLLPLPIATGRRFVNVVRLVCGRWCGMPIQPPYKAAPLPPTQRPDGMYEQDGGLHKRPWWPAMSARIEWIFSDRATGKDILWMLLHPIVGTLLAGLPVAIVAAGVWGAVEGRWWSLLAVPLGILVAPALIRGYGFWCALLLAPTRTTKLARIEARKRWIGEHLIALAQLLALGLTGIVASLSAVLMLIATALTFCIGLAPIFVPAANVVRRLAAMRRGYAGRWSDVSIAPPYRAPVPPDREPDGRYRYGKQLYRTEAWAQWAERFHRYVRDPATWRDFAWTAAEPVTGVVIALLPAALIYVSIENLIAPAVSSIVTLHFAPRYALGLIGAVVLVAAALASTVTLRRWHGRWTSVLLAPTPKARLNLRIEQLTETRSDAAADQADELRRIERDLHDGAQARLVAMGMALNAIEQLIDTDPAAARKLAVQARDTSKTALDELRSLVRGIHPPVLAERGLGPAVQALALDFWLPVTVSDRIAGRLSAPIESAAYFAVAETLANAVRHASATGVTVELEWDAGVLRMTVGDDGRGGADPQLGTGIAGVRRRLGTFDGTIDVSSPEGHGTVVRMELPCALSSPKTSSS